MFHRCFSRCFTVKECEVVQKAIIEKGNDKKEERLSWIIQIAHLRCGVILYVNECKFVIETWIVRSRKCR